MLEHVHFMVAVLARRFRARAVVELENLALRHQLHVLLRQRTGRPHPIVIDRMLWVWLSDIAALSGHNGVGQAGHRCPITPSRLPPVLALAFEIRTAVSKSRSSGFDSADERRQPDLKGPILRLTHRLFTSAPLPPAYISAFPTSYQIDSSLRKWKSGFI
jgi:hypothetical protein